ncbi:SgcJ/EcaC family oxidoreductase [Mucilaginibacter gilvus]|uniref:SgcJ/EcaC family oxidoreductase n=1 Tax=Mucilaginibacter gilvus TaxID=2305909 RepID=A0A3S3V1M8_9SPHI|nr:SgcJ/EcaC family oxidoreductase [Mucilaginibacter gilvus]RWY55925.1 SgcJ/EcaC family oxidoreductase [Mucilaginibacter gilvus]
MPNLKLTLTALLLMSSLFCYAQSDEKSIETQVTRMISDWNTHEFKNMDLYTTEDVEWVNIVGMWWKGRKDVKMAHQSTFDVFFNGVPFSQKSLNIRFLTGDVAIANLVCHVGSLFPPDGIDRGNNRTPETDNLLMLVYKKKSGIWLLSAGQNTIIDPEAAKHNPITIKTN